MSGASDVTYYAEFDAGGNWIKGQNLVARQTNGNSNTMNCNSISVDSNSQTVVACASASNYPFRANATVNSVPVPAYSGGDAFLQMLIIFFLFLLFFIVYYLYLLFIYLF